MPWASAGDSFSGDWVWGGGLIEGLDEGGRPSKSDASGSWRLVRRDSRDGAIAVADLRIVAMESGRRQRGGASLGERLVGEIRGFVERRGWAGYSERRKCKDGDSKS